MGTLPRVGSFPSDNDSFLTSTDNGMMDRECLRLSLTRKPYLKTSENSKVRKKIIKMYLLNLYEGTLSCVNFDDLSH